MRVLNLFGGPGSGKSTTAAGIFYYMKMQGRNVELVTEYAKDLVYSNTLHSMLDQQEYIFAHQNHRLHRLRDKVEWAITDSPILLATIYAQEDYPCISEFKELVKATHNTYDNTNIWLERPSTYQESGRIHTEEEAHEVDSTLHQMLITENIPLTTLVTGSNVVSLIIDHINNIS